jgi:hypothetical protein
MDRHATAIAPPARAPSRSATLAAEDRTTADELTRLRRLVDDGAFTDAVELARVLQRRPRVHRDVPILAATALAELGRLVEARALLERMAKLIPDEPAYAANLTRVLFLQEDWPAAWAAYAVRFRLMDRPPLVTRNAPGGTAQPVPRWDGRSRPARLLVIAEQGLGDTIQFARFLVDAAERCGSLACAAPNALHALLSSLQPAATLLPLERSVPLPPDLAWCALADLPGLLGLPPGSYPRPGAYLRADPASVAALEARQGPRFRPRIGLCWRGNPRHAQDAVRSAPLAAFAPLGRLDADWVSLQLGADPDELRSAPLPRPLRPLESLFDDRAPALEQTAALIATLDHVITVDTAMAHLAGALARPVSILIQRPRADWRWLARPHDTVWYPSARLFRQDRPGDWPAVLERVAASLA